MAEAIRAAVAVTAAAGDVTPQAVADPEALADPAAATAPEEREPTRVEAIAAQVRLGNLLVPGRKYANLSSSQPRSTHFTSKAGLQDQARLATRARPILYISTAEEAKPRIATTYLFF